MDWASTNFPRNAQLCLIGQNYVANPSFEEVQESHYFFSFLAKHIATLNTNWGLGRQQKGRTDLEWGTSNYASEVEGQKLVTPS